MKIRKVIQVLLLGGMVMIVGCEQSNTTNNERSEIEDKFSRLGEVYPTKDLEELMEKFSNKKIQILILRPTL